jgi:hypothetical protein
MQAGLGEENLEQEATVLPVREIHTQPLLIVIVGAQPLDLQKVVSQWSL